MKCCAIFLTDMSLDLEINESINPKALLESKKDFYVSVY
jgi:hypothetical protein